jgi:hypothetical protein
VNLQPLLFIGFGLAILFANVATSKLHKNIKEQFLKEAKAIKFRLVGDFFMPRRVLTQKGIKWRILLVISFVSCFCFGVGFTLSTKQEWVCQVFS